MTSSYTSTSMWTDVMLLLDAEEISTERYKINFATDVNVADRQVNKKTWKLMTKICTEPISSFDLLAHPFDLPSRENRQHIDTHRTFRPPRLLANLFNLSFSFRFCVFAVLLFNLWEQTAAVNLPQFLSVLLLLRNYISG